jgi:hypothetical protein
MTQYVVKIDERMTHNLIIEAVSAEEAVEKGYQLLRDGMTPEDEKTYGYDLESDGFTGQHDSWEY